MKKLLQPLRWALPALLLGGFGAQAQVISYPAASAVNAAGTYTDLGTGGTAIATTNPDDANSAAQNIGFPFSFNGASFTQFVLNTNGVLRLGSAAPSTAALYYENFAGGTGVDPLGTTATAADVNLIMPFNFDLEEGTGGTAEYRVQTTGTAPNQVCTIQWKNVKDKSEPGTGAVQQYSNFSFQAKLFQNGNIEFVYDAATAATGAVATRFPNVGLKGSGTGPNQVALALKGVPGAAWSTTTFINTNYGAQAHNINSAGLPDAGRTYRFVTGTVVPPVVPANDNPTGAIALTLGATCTSTSATNVNATVTTPNGYVNPSTTPATCGVAVNPKDVWFTFRTNAAGAGSTAANIGVTGTAAGMIRAFSAASSAGPFTQVSCAAGTGNNTQSAPLALTGLMAATTYYVSVSGFGSNDARGAFTICVTSAAITPPPVCGNTIMTQIANVTANSAQITFTAGAGNVSYNVTYTPTGGATTTVTPNPTASPITLSGLTASTGYALTIQSVCAAGLTGATLSGNFTTLSGLPAPANDNPTGAISLPVAATCTPTNATNAEATVTTPSGYVNPSTTPTTCGVAVNPKDVWFTFVATGTAATIAVTGTPAGIIRAFSAASSAGPFTQVSCAAGTGNNTQSAPLALTGLTAGTTYYVSVSGFGSGDAQGAFTICVTAPAAPTCNAVTGLSAASANNGTNAVVTFTPSATATSYTVTQQQLPGGTIVSQTATGSPATITGLTVNTTYLISVTSNCPNGQASAANTTPLRTVLAAREALGNGSLTVYPNPAQGSFVVSLPALAGERTAAVTLLNALGQTVYGRALELNAAGTQARVDVSGLAKGVYTLRVKTSNQTATKVVVVE